MSYIVLLLFALVACFGLQALALKAVGGRTTKSESNFFSSIGRIQAGAVGKPEVMLLGSSLTGRLPDRANGFKGFANMGCDGGSAIDALKAMDSGILPVAPVVVIEANTLSKGLDPTPSQVGAAMGKPWFRIGMRIPALSAYARPSAFAYSALLGRRIGNYGNPESNDGLGVTSLPSIPPSTSGVPLANDENAFIEETLPLLARLHAKGAKFVFVWLPPARADNSPPPAWILSLVAESGSLWWDLGQETNPELVTLTDGIHMAAPSAARTVISLRQGLDALIPSP